MIPRPPASRKDKTTPDSERNETMEERATEPTTNPAVCLDVLFERIEGAFEVADNSFLAIDAIATGYLGVSPSEITGSDSSPTESSILRALKMLDEITVKMREMALMVRRLQQGA